MSNKEGDFIYYICIGNLTNLEIDVEIISKYREKEKKTYKHFAKELTQQINLVRLNYGERHNQFQGGFNLLAISDKSLKYLLIAIVQTEYPTFKTFGLLDELNTKVEKYLIPEPKENRNSIQMIMVELQKNYNDPGQLSIYLAQQEINQVRNTMRKQLQSVCSNIESSEVYQLIKEGYESKSP